MVTSSERPLLMIPGPVEISPRVARAHAAEPLSHMSAELADAFARSLESIRTVWKADRTSQPFVVAGSGTTAMDMVVANMVEPGTRAVAVCTGYFSDRIVEMLRRAGADVVEVRAAAGDVPRIDDVRNALERAGTVDLLVATHVDTSTGARVDPEPLARLAREREIISVFDGVCATGAERFEMSAWDADVYLTASQKALGLPPGLGLFVASERALARRARRRGPKPPMVLDWELWLPVMRSYEARAPKYFATPATCLVAALAEGLAEILEHGIDARVAAQARVGHAMRAAWRALGLELVPVRAHLAADTLSAIWKPLDPQVDVVSRIAAHGAIVAGGLHPDIRARYFRVGHMGYAATQPAMLERTVRAVALGLRDAGFACDVDAGLGALRAGLSED